MSDYETPTRFVSHGIDVVCPICGNDTFVSGKAELTTLMDTFFRVEPVTREVQMLTCGNCRHILWFDDDDD